MIPSPVLGLIASLSFAFGFNFACSSIFTKNAASSALVAGLSALITVSSPGALTTIPRISALPAAIINQSGIWS